VVAIGETGQVRGVFCVLADKLFSKKECLKGRLSSALLVIELLKEVLISMRKVILILGDGGVSVDQFLKEIHGSLRRCQSLRV
jgi:hypothetical protein